MTLKALQSAIAPGIIFTPLRGTSSPAPGGRVTGV